MKQSRLIVVLGMHRSGTSVITRALRVLGVSLGERFLPPNEDNPKGFWEDVDINALNIEMLNAINSDWHNVSLVEVVDLKELYEKGFFDRAVEILLQKVSDVPIFAFKDPRVAKLLPFWKEVFKHCQFDVSYVMALRHPLSVVKSLAERNGFDPEKSYLMWLGHVITGLKNSADSKRVLIDYDRMMLAPERELDRIANRIGLVINTLELQNYKTDFLDLDLRHTVYDLNDLLLDDACPSLVREIYADLLEVASDKTECDDCDLQAKVEQWSNEFLRLKSLLLLIDRLFKQKLSTDQAVIERDEQLVSLNQVVAERDEQLVSLNQVVAERDEQLVSLNQVVAERDEQLVSLNQVVAERDEQLVSLNQVVAERDEQLVSLNQVVAERDEQLVSLNQVVAERDEQIANLAQQQSMQNSELLRLNAERVTFGAMIGRGITSLTTRIAPPGTSRGDVVGMISKFFTSLFVSGWKVTAERTCRHLPILQRMRSTRNGIFREGLRSACNVFVRGDQKEGVKIQTDHPQLRAWIDAHEPTSEQLTAQRSQAELFTYKPLLSVIIPIYKVPCTVLDETLASLEHQTYSNWQACIVWSDIEDQDGWTWLQERTSRDQRFKIKLLTENGGISRNSNAAFELVDGEFIVLLDHDDTLAYWAFFEIIERLQSEPELDFIYSDKDSITADGMTRLNALFKPEWSPEMLHSVNYLTHLNVIRTSLVQEINGWRPETDGAQDWDLFFRITERTKNIARVPSILYHWRILPTSTATGLAAKPYAASGQLKSQQDYFIRRGLSASVVPSPDGMFQVCWPSHKASTDVIVYQTGTINQLVTVLDILRAGKQGPIRCIYVIHHSPMNDALGAFHHVWPGRIEFKQIEKVNWRTALEETPLDNIAETILLLDGGSVGSSETMVEELSGWVTQHPDIAWASAIALNPGGTVYEAGRVVAANNQSAPMFDGAPLFTFGWFGGPLWYRNARACSPYAVAIKGKNMIKALKKIEPCSDKKEEFVTLCLALADDGRRGLIDPFARVYFNQPPETHYPNDGYLFHVDPYFSPAFDQVNPLRLHS